MHGTQFAKKEDRLAEAAKLHLRCGQFREFCEIQVKLGNFEQAMAFAPAVSIEFWQEIADKCAKGKAQRGDEDAPLTCIIANQCDKAVELLA